MSRVLVADDDASVRRELKALLEGAGYAVELASDGQEAVRKAAAAKFDVVLLDVVMPGLGGLEACRAIKARAGEALLPVLLLVAKTDATSRARGIGAGADDWVQKPLDPPALLARVASLVRMKSIHDDVREARALLERMTGRDELTGLVSYRSLEGELRERIGHASRYKEPLAAALLDIDGLETINQRFGRATGDLLLRALADAVRATVREHDIAVRYGPDEVLLLLPQTHLLAALPVVDATWRAFGPRVKTATAGKVSATLSAGVSSYPSRDVRDAEELLRAADFALGSAKRGGGNRVCGFQQHGLLYTPGSAFFPRGPIRSE